MYGMLKAILQFCLDFGDLVLHDADPSLRTFFRSCLSREFADPVVAEATIDFLNVNKKKLLTSFPTLLPQSSLNANVDCMEWGTVSSSVHLI
ncbi:hypothetical protein M0R45_008047 [Rubus argutus]|uniref:AP-5 complex subunit zeta-1 ARM repeats domain-containing protein n=1 Tax=Rubus argutus TaxID=59490 RepID=A0AAW1Y0W9_RUBAR